MTSAARRPYRAAGCRIRTGSSGSVLAEGGATASLDSEGSVADGRFTGRRTERMVRCARPARACGSSDDSPGLPAHRSTLTLPPGHRQRSDALRRLALPFRVRVVQRPRTVRRPRPDDALNDRSMTLPSPERPRLDDHLAPEGGGGARPLPSRRAVTSWVGWV